METPRVRGAAAPEIEKCDAGGDVEEPVPAAAAREQQHEERVPPWREQVTARGLVAALLIGFVYTVIILKLALTTGIIPTLNVSAALLAFLALRGWTRALARLGVASRPFTRQENAVVQTCAVACYTMGFGGGFGSSLLALNKKTYELAGVSTPGNAPGSYKEPGFGWMAGFLLAISFVGLLNLLPLRKALVIDYKLTYPSGTATAVLINGFHTSQGEKNAKKQVRGFLRCFVISLLWSFFQWFYTGGPSCGFLQFPTFGLKAWKQTFFFDFSLTYVGAGMICSHLVNLSTLFGAILSWGIMWPLISKQKGIWYPANVPETSMTSLFGYKSFMCVALIMGDGLYHFIKVTGITAKSLHGRSNRKHVKRAWGGKDDGVIAGLVGCGIVKQLVQVSADLMHDYKTGHLTLTSPRSMLVGQAIGTAMGCIIAPSTFLLFYKSFDIGNPDGYWKAPYALIYRNMAILGVDGFSALPKHCLELSAALFAFSVLINLVRDLLPRRYRKYVPLPMAMAVPFLVGANFAIDMCVGSLTVFAWHKMNSKEAALLVPAVASGFICGDGIWMFPSSLLSLAKVNAPICMNFTPGS
ncbi:metal-nicotianamine transporter YSL2 isoform X2 [Brachypodium distachyon]|uniref:metal-nicotianamine transporter YSL2 isoform X2 n=1 Tax=Brachypodium distachyon TaxID=15368 RepID=UPI0001C747AB|nr:metal-nicotianamine transporter YSL2 isoform X2 [Brachypodium distachyon]|eukprot:XP_024317716.1 metal-nicotianamine transporter YSL2 isoform X2 [Brachypodium distachyon]